MLACINTIFFFIGLIIFHCTHIYNLFTHLSLSGHWASVSNPAINMYIKVFIWIPILSSFGYVPRRELLSHLVILCLIFLIPLLILQVLYLHFLFGGFKTKHLVPVAGRKVWERKWEGCHVVRNDGIGICSLHIWLQDNIWWDLHSGQDLHLYFLKV